MKKYLIFFCFLVLTACSKHKTILICGDHVCVNKEEAELYFEENLTLEVKILNKDKNKQIDLVQLNLRNHNNSKKIILKNQEKTEEEIKILSNNQIKDIKLKVKNKKKKLAKKKDKKIEKEKTHKSKQNIEKPQNRKLNTKTSNEIVDICTILEKCSIDEISKYLIKRGKEKSFPDITIRE